MNVPSSLRILACVSGLFLSAAVCSAGPAPSQVYYVPFPEDNQLAGFNGVSSAAVDPLAVFVTFSASADNTVIYYDQWEDGYEADISNPTQSTTQVFGDGNPANGYPPGNASDLISAGTVFSLRNYVTSTSGNSILKYDARDKIASFKPISLTKTSFPAVTNTLLAGSVEVFERGLWGTEYRVPVGVDMPTTTPSSTLAADADSFAYSALSVMAGAGGATVQLDGDNNGAFESTVTLAEGETTYMTGIYTGGRVVSDRPVQVILFTGRPGSNYQSRSMSLLPEYRWSSSYYAPVSTSVSYGTAVILYNPGASNITVSYDYRSSATAYTTNTVTVPAGGNARVNLAPSNGSSNYGAYHFYTTGSTPPAFYALCAVDCANTSTGSNQAFDGGFTLVGQPSLTTQVLVSLGIGRDPYSATNPSENGNPVWITTVGNGNTQETVYVDFNGDNSGALTDPNGNRYDVSYNLRELEQQKIFDPDGDQSGMLVYVLNPDVKIAAGWAQDPTIAATGQPGLDVATLIPPLREGDGAKGSSVTIDTNGDGYRSAGDTLEYDIRTINTARVAINGPFTIKDNLPVDVTYVPGSTMYRYSVGGAWQAWVPVPDDVSGTVFPLDLTGFSVPGTLGVGQQIQVVFKVSIKDYPDLTPGITKITNTGSIIVTPYGITVELEWSDLLYGSIGDRVWVDANGNGIQDVGEAGLDGVTVYADGNNNGVRDSGEPYSITSGDGSYLLPGLLAGNYIVRVDAASVAALNPGYGATYDLDGIATSYVANVTLAAAQSRADVDFGFRVGASVGDRVWIDRNGDGVQGSGEPGINGVRVFIDTNGNGSYNAGEPNAITFGDGSYYIGNLNAGTYSVCIDTTTLPVGATQTFDLDGVITANKASVTLIGVEHRADLDFGYRGTLSIGDLVWNDIDGNGVRIVYNVINGRIDINNSGGTDNNDDGTIGSLQVINGYVDLNGDGSITAADVGTFQGITVIAGGLDVNNSGTVSNSDDATGAVGAEAGIANVRVYIDGNGNGVWDNTEAFATTNASGIYSIPNLFNGTYTLRVDTTTLPTSMAQTYDLTNPTTDNQATVILSGASRTDVDFGYRDDASLGDRVWNDRNNNGVQDPGEPGIEGVLVYIDANANGAFNQGVESYVLTDVNGNYHFSNLAAGTYVVRLDISTLPSGSTQTYDLDGLGTANQASRTLVTSEDASNVDFGYRSAASAGDFVWLDANANGVQDGGEAGINGVRVYLDMNGNGVFDSASEPSAITAGNGAYTISGLVAGAYTARVDASTLPVGMIITYDLAGGLDNAATFMLAPNQVRTDVDFGYTLPVTIGDHVWSDLNVNGVQDSGEPGLDGVTVTVYNANTNAIIETTLTADGGDYAFSNLLPNTYYVEFGPIAGYSRTLVDQGSDDAKDSDADLLTGRTGNVTLSSGQSNLTLDAGYYAPVTIGDIVFNDANANGVQDSGETGLDGVFVSVYRPGFGLDGIAGNADDATAVATQTTPSNGAYSFTGLPAGTYQVGFGPLAGYTRTLADQGADDTKDCDANATTGLTVNYVLAAGETNNTIDAGYYEPGSVFGHLYIDTNGNGTQDIGEPHLANVNVIVSDANGSPQTVTTDASGNWTASVPPGSTSAKVDETDPDYPTGYTQTEGIDPTVVTAVSGTNTDAGIDGYYLPGTIFGHLYIDTNGNGTQDSGEPDLADINVIVTDSNGNPQTVTTNSTGDWTASVPPGSTTADVDETDPQYPIGLTQTEGDDPTTITAIAGSNIDAGIDGYYQPGTIFGHLYIDTNGNGTQDSGEPDLADVDVIVTDSNGNPQTVTTNSTGDWSASVPPGSTSVDIDEADPQYPSGYIQTEGNDPTTVTAVSGVSTDAGVDGYYLSGSLSGTVYVDTDGDGDADTTLGGVLIRLLDDVGNPVLDGFGDPITTLTLPDGSYVFGGLPPGDYGVLQDQPFNYASVSDSDGPNDNVIGNVIPIVVTAGQNNTGNDFIEIELGSISGYVRIDTDNNGSGDAPLVGVFLNLLDGSGSPMLDGFGAPVQASTNSGGFYEFTQVPIGTYRVSQIQPAGYASVSDVDGANNNVVGDETPIVMTPGLAVTGRDFVEIEFGAISGHVFKDTNDDGSGDTAYAGVTLTLLDGSGNPVDGDSITPGVQLVTAVTGLDGSYRFDSLVPGNYQVSETQPTGFGSVSDADGGDLDLIGNIAPLTVNPGQEVVDRDFVEIELGIISGYVFVGSSPLSGVILTLLDEFGDPVDGDPDAPGVQPVTTVTSPLGYYEFSGVIPGIYQVGQTQPYGYDSFGDIDGGDINIIGDVSPITIIPGQHSENNNFIETLDTCPDDWNEWKYQHPAETAAGNPDNDAYDNFAEFAFAMPYDSGTGSPWLGNTAWVIQPSSTLSGTIEGVFVRPKGAPLNVTYTLQYAATPGDPTVWQSVVITPLMFTADDNGDCTETITINDLETLTGLTGGKGVVRIRADLDDDGGGNGDVDHTSYVETEGWTVTDLEICCRTYNNPYQRETAFTGTVTDVSGQVLTLAASDDLSTLLSSGGVYYLEVTSGANEGHRFDIVSTSGNTVTLASDLDLYSAAAPFNTLAGSVPLSVGPLLPGKPEGDQVAIHRHWTLDEIFPPTGFGATGSQSDADQIQVFAGGAWTIYWLYDENDADPNTARWVDAADSGMLDQGATVIPPGQGMYFNNRTGAASILAYGEIRQNDFIRPHAAGNNLVGGGYPVDQSANGSLGRGMSMTTGFFGSRDFKTADSIFVWKADSTIGDPGYDTYYLLGNIPSQPALTRWVKVGDASILSRDSEILLLGNRSVFTRSANAVPAYKISTPWSP